MRVEEKLAALLACRTISDPDERDPAEFQRLRRLLPELFPAAFSATEEILISDDSILRRWRGTASDRPVLLMAHHDVVAVSADDWSCDPFAGVIADGRVRGRGALDDKGPLTCILQSIDEMAAEGVVPAQDVYIFSGADEETAGEGAVRASAWFDAHGVALWLVQDEGGAFVEAGMLGATGANLIAAVGIAEKGSVDVHLVANAVAGHSSTPTRGGAAERIGEAVVRISRYEPEPRIPAAVRIMLSRLGSLVPSELEPLIFSDDLALGSAMKRLGPDAAAMTGTTMAVTRLSGSNGDNVIPSQARATVNVRLSPGDTIALLRSRLESLLAGLEIEIERMVGEDPPPSSLAEGPGWDALCAAIHDIAPEVMIVPYLQTGATDSRRFAWRCPNVFRFAPLQMLAADRAGIHGANESISIAELGRGVRYYRALISRLESLSVFSGTLAGEGSDDAER